MCAARPSSLRFALIIYGSLETTSGGYLYDRKLVQAIEARGHSVELVSLPWRNYARHLADALSPRWRHIVRDLRDLRADIVLQDELNHPSLAFVNSPRQAEGAAQIAEGAAQIAERAAQIAERAAHKAGGAPSVAVVHHLRSSERHPTPLRPLYRAVERRYLATVDGFLCNSESTRAAVAAMLPGRALRACVAHPAADHLAAAPHSAVSVSLREDAPLRILFVGNLIPRKGLHTLIDALALMQRPATLAVAGNPNADPAYTGHIHARIARLGLRARVQLLGPVPDSELAALYDASDLFALPSFEGFGIVYLEAMAHGCPVIASTAGAAHELIIDGANGYLVPPDDAPALAARLDALAADPALRARLSAAARARFAAHPTWAESMGRAAAWLEGFAP